MLLKLSVHPTGILRVDIDYHQLFLTVYSAVPAVADATAKWISLGSKKKTPFYPGYGNRCGGEMSENVRKIANTQNWSSGKTNLRSICLNHLTMEPGPSRTEYNHDRHDGVVNLYAPSSFM